MRKLTVNLFAFLLLMGPTTLVYADVVTLGSASDRFEVGEVLYDAGFNEPEDWTVQIQDSDSGTTPTVSFDQGVLDLYMPYRGCTAWLKKKKFRGPIAITYRVRCPEETLGDEGIQARDINNFWHASDPVNAENLFDPELYTGGFGSYSKMHGYYASTGGGGETGNRTTRARRYPREDYEGNPIPHIALNERDGQDGYLITPGVWHEVQLVAADGLVQYIVDGKIVYEYDEGGSVTVENGDQPVVEKTYSLEEFPAHTEGYFGLRMVRTHHQYADLKVYQLEATASSAEGLDIRAYIEAADDGSIFPSARQIEMLEPVIPLDPFQPAPPIDDRNFWDRVAASDSGVAVFEKALSELGTAPEIPISDELYRLARETGDRTLYKPRYYDSMERLELYMLAECMENEGRFLPQIEVYLRAIMDMKSWLHPNHDDQNNGVLEGRRVSIDLGARKFGSDLALAKALLEDRLPGAFREEIDQQIQWRIVDTYLTSCKTNDRNNHWIKSTSNWNSVCTSGSMFTVIAGANDPDERLAAVGSALNSMVHYLSGFGADGYCSEGVGYWGYGFGHYLYLADVLYDYTGGQIDLFEWDGSGKLQQVGLFPERCHIQYGNFPAFSDSKPKSTNESGYFAKAMAAKHYGSQWPYNLEFEDAIECLIHWQTPFTESAQGEMKLPGVTYFDDMGIVISRGKQEIPLSIAIKAGHNAENHNHSDVGSYSLMLGEEFPSRDIGSPSYNVEGAFNKDNKARSSWGHSVPRIDNTLQSNGRSFEGKILKTEFTDDRDRVVIDIKSAYEVPALEKLIRTMENDKSGKGSVVVTDEFTASEAVEFGTAIMTYARYEIIDSNSVTLTTDNHKVKVEIEGNGANLKVSDEEVPVVLGSFKTAYRIGIDFAEPLREGSISVRYTPVCGKGS